MPIHFLDLKAQYASLKSEIDAAIQEVIDTSAFALGPNVERFEQEFAQYCGSKHCIGVNSGTAALTLLLKAYDIGPGDEVITVANTFFATAEAISLVGADVVLVDCKEDDALIDVSKIEAAITEKAKVIMPVHLYGQPADMDEINSIAQKHDLILIEDACQAHGAKYQDKRAGNLGDAAAFSCYPGKNLGAYGEAGAVTTNDEKIATKIKELRDHGMSQKYHHDDIGYNERMDGIQGAVLSVKLSHLDEWNEKRRAHAKQYQEKLSGIGDIKLFSSGDDRSHVYHLFVIRTSKRDELQQHLQKKEIHTGIHYPIPIHMQKAYEGKWQQGDFSISEMLGNEILSLPMYAELTEAQIDTVCDAIKEFYS